MARIVYENPPCECDASLYSESEMAAMRAGRHLDGFKAHMERAHGLDWRDAYKAARATVGGR